MSLDNFISILESEIRILREKINELEKSIRINDMKNIELVDELCGKFTRLNYLKCLKDKLIKK